MVPNFNYDTLLGACRKALNVTGAHLPCDMNEFDLASEVYLKIADYEKPLHVGAYFQFAKQVILDKTLRSPSFTRNISEGEFDFSKSTIVDEEYSAELEEKCDRALIRLYNGKHARKILQDTRTKFSSSTNDAYSIADFINSF